MAITLFTPTADNHTNAIRAVIGIIARTTSVLPSIAHTRVVMIAANYALSAQRLSVNHV